MAIAKPGFDGPQTPLARPGVLAVYPRSVRSAAPPGGSPVVKSLAVRSAVALIGVTACALLAGCLTAPSGTPSESLAARDPTAPTSTKPPATRAGQIVVRPEQCTAPVRGTQVFIATVYDADGKPRPDRRVEWIVEGPGSIVEVGGRGVKKADHRFGFAETEAIEREVRRGRDRFTIRPGQTWCAVTSAVEGETTVAAFCPAIDDWSNNRAYGKVTWSDGAAEFPPPATARAGGDCQLKTVLTRPAAGYRIRYRILDGPPAALTRGPGEVSSVTEAVTPVGEDGTGRVSINQPLPAPGTNRIGIEVVKSDPDRPGQFTVVSRGDTRVTWQAPGLQVTVTGPGTLGLNQDAAVTYTVASSDTVGAGPVTLTARLPDGMDLLQTEPKAAVDGDTLIWAMPALTAGREHVVRATVRPSRVGPSSLTAEARTQDGAVGRGRLPVAVTQAKLLLKIDGPKAAVVGEALPFQVTVTNAGDRAAERIRVQAKLEDGLETAGRAATFDETVAALAPGQSKVIALPVSATRGGRMGLEVSAAAGRGGTAVPQTATVEVKEVQLALTAHGPGRAFVGQEVTWQLVIRNNGDVALGNTVVKADLPPGVSFVKATDGGRVVGKKVVWDLSGAPARQERAVAVTAVCNNASGRAALRATVSATPVVERDGARRPVSLVKPFVPARPAEAVVEIVGVAALQMSVRDSADPVGVGQPTTYSVRVKNAGTAPARDVRVTAEIPRGTLRPTRAAGPAGPGKIAEQREPDGYAVAFPSLATLAPNAEATFVIEAEGLVPGDVRVRFAAGSPSQAHALNAEEATRVIRAEVRPAAR